MEFNLEHTITVLSNTPALVRRMLADMPEECIRGNEGEGTWNPFDVLGHFIHGETTDWIPRTRIILSDAADKTFETFDRFAQFRNSKDKSLEQLLNEFESLRKENIRALLGFNITPQDLQREGNHPALGKVTLAQLLSTWVVHDLDHLGQVLRVVAKQHRATVGPWAEYLSILSWKSLAG
jgi:uncharacterized damage-inducible protein DinB